MLSIGKLGRGQERYYLDKVAEGAEDYYSGEAEAEGYWLGDAAEDLGLQGKVEPAQLVAMLTGSDPSTGGPLGLRHVEGGAVPGFDLTFSAPKSFSLAWALGGHPVAAEVKAAHAAAVQAGLDYLQRPPAGPAAVPEGMSSSRETASSPPATSTAPPAPAIPSCIPMSSSPTLPRGRTTDGPGSTTRRYTNTRPPPATSTRRT
jgi:hypothetical protein